MKDKIAAITVFSLEPLYYSKYFDGFTPTLDNPVSVDMDVHRIHVRIRSMWLYNRETGKILRKIDYGPSASAQESSAPEVPSFLLMTTPSGATAFFDGNHLPRCATPCNVALDPGTHEVTLRSPGYRDSINVIQVPRDSGINIELETREGRLQLTSNPLGLAIVVDGKEREERTPTLLTLSVGTHRVRVIKGSEYQEFTVETADGDMQNRFIDWVR